MKNKIYNFRKKVRLKIIIIVLMIFSIILSFAAFFYISEANNYEQQVLMDVLGRQRMLTQSMAKDTGHIYSILQTEKTDNSSKTPILGSADIDSIKNNFSNAKSKFLKTLTELNNGYITYQNQKIELGSLYDKIKADLSKANEIWFEFEKSTDTVLQAEELNATVAQAVEFINKNDDTLLNYSDDILKTATHATKINKQASIIISTILISLFLVVLVISIFSLYRYILLPLDDLYKGLSDIGMTTLTGASAPPTKKDIPPIVGEIGEMFRKIDGLISLIENINNSSSFSETLNYIFNSFAPFIPYNYIGIALIKDGGETIEATYGISDGTILDMPEALMNKKYDISKTSLEKILETGNVRVINDLDKYIEHKQVGEYTEIIMNAGVRSSITLPLNINNKHVGIIFFSSRFKNIYNDDHIKFLKVIVNSIAICFDKNIFVDELLYSSLLALAKLAEARDEETGQHLERMKEYSKLIAQLLFTDSKYKNEITPKFIYDIDRFSPMHDIGKVGIEDGILLKPGKLTEDEYTQMKKHTGFGAQVLQAAEDNIALSGRSMFKLGIEIAEGHHEKWDGSGYPGGRSGQEIPLSARIVAVADVFDALTSRRPYKEPFSFEDSFKIIKEGSGRHFDPEIVGVFEANKTLVFDLYNSFNMNK